VQIAPLLTAAGNLAWAQREFAAELSIDTLLAAAEGPAPNLVFLPYLGGERSPFRDTSVRGAFLGITSHTTRADFLFALLEGVAFAFRHAAEVLGVQASGPHDRPWVVSGGGARSHTWMQRFADVLGRPLTRLDDAATVGLRGAWHSAVVAEGHVDSYGLVSSGTTVTPSDEHASERAAREARYRAFRAATDALRPVYADWRAELDEVGMR
jgi:Sugar (pentulose and hexulose) kinases